MASSDFATIDGKSQIDNTTSRYIHTPQEDEAGQSLEEHVASTLSEIHDLIV